MPRSDPNPLPVDAVLDAVDACVVVLDEHGTIVAFNRKCERISGARMEDVVGHPVWDVLLAPESAAEARRAFAEIGAGTTGPHTTEWTMRDGAQRTIVWSTTHGDEHGAARLVVGTGFEVDGTHAEASIRDREERLRAVVNTAVDGIVTIDRHGIIDSFNPAAERIFGYTAAEVIGGPIERLMPAPYRDEHSQYLDNYLTTGVRKIIGIGREVRGRRKDGLEFPMDLAVSEVRELDLFVGIVRDLTERRRAEEKLRQVDRMASIGSLAAGLGHDMNNVLLPMRGRLDALEAAGLAPELRQHLRAIRDSVGYLQQLTDGLHLLALDPLDADSSGPATDLALWWDQVGPLLQRSLPRHVRLASSMPTDLPRAAVAPHRLTQVALNLFVNAGHAVGVEGRVRISAELGDDGTVVLTVSDNGSGMSPEVRARAFEAFYSTRDRGRGTGLGLALVHGIVTSAGGSIDIESEPRRGTKMILRFPAADATGPVRDEGGGRVPLAAVISLNDERIASLMSSFLEAEGFRVALDSTADPEHAALWITSPAVADVSAVQRFLKSAEHQVIACGTDAGAWGRIGALVIEDVMDFELVRDQIGKALQRLVQARA